MRMKLLGNTSLTLSPCLPTLKLISVPLQSHTGGRPLRHLRSPPCGAQITGQSLTWKSSLTLWSKSCWLSTTRWRLVGWLGPNSFQNGSWLSWERRRQTPLTGHCFGLLAFPVFFTECGLVCELLIVWGTVERCVHLWLPLTFQRGQFGTSLLIIWTASMLKVSGHAAWFWILSNVSTFFLGMSSMTLWFGLGFLNEFCPPGFELSRRCPVAFWSTVWSMAIPLPQQECLKAIHLRW